MNEIIELEAYAENWAKSSAFLFHLLLSLLNNILVFLVSKTRRALREH